MKKEEIVTNLKTLKKLFYRASECVEPNRASFIEQIKACNTYDKSEFLMLMTEHLDGAVVFYSLVKDAETATRCQHYLRALYEVCPGILELPLQEGKSELTLSSLAKKDPVAYSWLLCWTPKSSKSRISDSFSSAFFGGHGLSAARSRAPEDILDNPASKVNDKMRFNRPQESVAIKNLSDLFVGMGLDRDKPVQQAREEGFEAILGKIDERDTGIEDIQLAADQEVYTKFNI